MGTNYFSYLTIVRTGSETCLPPIRYGTVLGVNWVGCEVDHLPHLVPRLRMNAALPSSSHMPSQ